MGGLFDSLAFVDAAAEDLEEVVFSGVNKADLTVVVDWEDADGVADFRAVFIFGEAEVLVVDVGDFGPGGKELLGGVGVELGLWGFGLLGFGVLLRVLHFIIIT